MTELRQLFLLRHAKSSWDDPALDDFDRPLNNRGRRNAAALADHFRASAIRPALILCSAARRTRETYAVLEPAIEGVPVTFEAELYEATRHDLLDRLRRLDDHLQSVLLIGHNPGLEHLATELCQGQGNAKRLARLAEKFPTCALATLEAGIAHWGALQDGTCRLTGFLRPADLD
ncbi:MAG TPA: histidine phosphatase family protein [Magnetospirillum sp.]|nr:histidine phosphatase family protein [Magnetospirillum sp.]